MKKGTKIFLSILAVFVAVIIVVGGGLLYLYNIVSDPSEIVKYETDNPAITGEVMVSAHRSGGGIAPEQTMMAFKNCVESDTFNTDIFEFDLHITKDNVLVLLHDDTLDRTSDSVEVFGEEEVRPENKTYEELRQLNMGAKFEDENGNTPYASLKGADVPDELKIVRLEEVLDYLMSKGDYDYIIEIKNGEELGKKASDALYKVMKEKDLFDDVIFGSFNEEISLYMDENYPEIKRSSTIKEVLEFYIKALIGKDELDVPYVALQIPYKLYCVNLGTADVINYAHKNNLAVQYWTINDEEEIKYLASLGADCIISDYPDKVYDLLDK